MGEADIISLIFFTIMWILPIIWMFVFRIKTHKYDFLVNEIALPLLFLIIFGIFMSYTPHPTFGLISFYGIITLLFTSILVNSYNWDLPSALSISALICMCGSFYWELPIIIQNYIIRGWENDIILQLAGLCYFLFIAVEVGWIINRKSILLLSIGLLVSISITYLMGPVPTISPSSYWNSPPYMFVRLFCTLILFKLLKKDVPK